MGCSEKNDWIVELYLPESLYAFVCKVLEKNRHSNFRGGGRPNYIDPSAHFDGVDYKLITLGTNDVISKEVLFLTHDYSIFRALKYIDRESDGERILRPITVGNNVFIGARCTLLPGTVIEDNVIVGAGSIVKGRIKSGTVVAGNPARPIESMEAYAKKWLEKQGKL